MTESLLHYIWKHKLLGTPYFTGVKNEQIELVHTGTHNTNAGPDFFNAQLKIDNVLLAGNVEIHIRTSDWVKHKHQHDKAYDNLVLHAVFEHDMELPQNTLNHVPVLQLKEYITTSILEQYQAITTSRDPIPCGKGITSVSGIAWSSWLSRLAISRLEDKVQYAEQLFRYTNNHFEETLYMTLCKNFGFKINSPAFELLARQLSYSIIQRHADNQLAVEALLFGVAGFLDDTFEEEYPRLLQNEFEFLKHKYQLVPLKKETWKFLRLRPVNFPTVRLAQLAAVFCKSESLFHIIDRLPSQRDIQQFFEASTHPFWDTHYKFETPSGSQAKQIGESSISNIIINTIVPYLFFLSRHHPDQRFADHALDLLSEVAAEKNNKTKPYEDLGVKVGSALESQALIHLYDNFCSSKRCLDCSVAGFLLKREIKL